MFPVDDVLIGQVALLHTGQLKPGLVQNIILKQVPGAGVILSNISVKKVSLKWFYFIRNAKSYQLTADEKYYQIFN